MTEIFLEGLEFYARHGVYAEEASLGNRFEVDLHIGFTEQGPSSQDKLQNTLDYVSVYQIVKNEMEIRSRLLEHLADRIGQQLLDEFGEIHFLSVKISKLNPPLSGLCKRVSVQKTWNKSQDQA